MFVDASGGAAGGDAYTCAVAHREGEHVILDAVRGVTGRLDPAKVTRDYAELAKQYGVGMVSGDRYGAEWVASAWRECGVAYQRSSRQGPQIYLESLPLFARGVVRVSKPSNIAARAALARKGAPIEAVATWSTIRQTATMTMPGLSAGLCGWRRLQRRAFGRAKTY